MDFLQPHLAYAIVIKGKSSKGSQLNPYRRFNTRWYCWETGRNNPSFSATSIVDKLRELGYPIGV